MTAAMPQIQTPAAAAQRAKVRLAVAGGGFGAAHHWHEHPNCEITAVTNLVEERRQAEVEYYHPGIGTRHNSLSRWQGIDSWRFGFPPMLYPTHSLGLLVGVTKERIVKVSCIGQRIGDDFPEASENQYENPFENEIALGVTNLGNICRFAVCWNIAAHGEKLSLWMDGSAGQPLARRAVAAGVAIGEAALDQPPSHQKLTAVHAASIGISLVLNLPDLSDLSV